MASFDPDKYLAEKSAAPSGFDPDKYLQEKIAPQPSPDEQKRVQELRQYDSPYTAAAHAAANVGLMGYLPEAEAAASRLGSKLGDLYYGVDQEKAQKYGIKDSSYEEELAKAKDEQNKLAEHNPISTIAGSVGGAVLQAPAMAAGLAKAGIGAGGGLLARLGKSAAVGAGVGAIQNPADIKPGDDQITARGKNALLGAGFGAGGEALGSIASSAIGKLRAIPESAQAAAADKALKAAGGMLKDFSRKDAKQLGEFAIDNNLIKPGESFGEVADRATALKQDLGEKIGAVYDKIGTQPVDPAEIAKRLASAASKKIGKADISSNRALANEAQEWIDAIVKHPEVQAGDVRSINDFVGELAGEINHAKKGSATGAGLNGREKVLESMRGELRDFVNEIAEKTGNPELVDLNKAYSRSTDLSKIAAAKDARISANQSMGLTDKITATGLAGGLLAHGGIAAAPQAAALGLAGAAANKLGREYGNPILMEGLLKGGRAAENVLGNIEGLVPEAYQGLIGKTVTDPRVQLLNAARVNKRNK